MLSHNFVLTISISFIFILNVDNKTVLRIKSRLFSKIKTVFRYYLQFDSFYNGKNRRRLFSEGSHRFFVKTFQESDKRKKLLDRV